MKVSVITVCYNSDKTIEDTIKSVISQSYSHIEYIIIDGGSKDGTLDIIQKYSNSINKVVSEPDSGIFDAINKGMSAATGEIICILNSDDIYADNNIIENAIELFNIHNNLEVVYGNIQYVNASDTSINIRKVTSRNMYNKFFEEGHIIPHPSLFLKSSLIKKSGLYNLNLKSASDYEYILRMFKFQKPNNIYIDSVFVKMRIGGFSNKNIINIINANNEILKSWKLNNLNHGILFLPKRIFMKIKQVLNK